MDAVIGNLDRILFAFWATVRLTAASAVVSLILGTLLAAMRVSPLPVLRAAGTVYVNALRNTPLTLVLLACGLGLSATLGLNYSNDDLDLNNFWLGVTGLSAYTAAFVCEALRSGINTVPMGQAEAARSIGLTFPQTLTLVVLPQAFRAVIAPLGSVLIALTKNTTVVFVVGYLEASREMKLIFDEGGASVVVFAAFATGFLILTLPMGLFFGWLAKRMAVTR
jgi:glutamate transport system permease protein